jgi:hypothetical protein
MKAAGTRARRISPGAVLAVESAMTSPQVNPLDDLGVP